VRTLWRTGCALLLVALAACQRTPVVDDLVLDFRESGQHVTVLAETSFELKPANDAIRRRVDAARAAALANTDPWAVRFARLQPVADSTTFRRDQGALHQVIRSVTIPHDDLQLVFADTNITVKTLRGDGWRELSFFPGSSTRATRDQQRAFEGALALWSEDIARYLTAVHETYAYLDRRPQRARYVFAAILDERGEDGAPPIVLEEEQLLVDTVRESMERIASRMDASQGDAVTFAEQADLLFNPFPARVTVRVPGTILASQGFSIRDKGKDVVIEPVELFETLASLEGVWLTPDPLSALLREEPITSVKLAEIERESTALVSGSEIAREVRSRLARPQTYALRWRE
jgi:hypothetical protein